MDHGRPDLQCDASSKLNLHSHRLVLLPKILVLMLTSHHHIIDGCSCVDDPMIRGLVRDDKVFEYDLLTAALATGVHLSSRDSPESAVNRQNCLTVDHITGPETLFGHPSSDHLSQAST